MTSLALTVNGERTSLEVEPRTHLGDALREKLNLTGTHLGCEHGVCGACTVLVDGAPVRSCITFAVACEGQEVRSIEGFEDDALMRDLREAFSREHALQCGFCTAGMLIASRDIVLRLPDADEARIRHELSGNLCRCTGYLGIVRAVRSVVEKRKAAGPAAVVTAASSAAPVPTAFTPFASSAGPAESAAAAAPARPQEAAPLADTARQGWTRFEESFPVGRPAAQVWEALKDFALVASCLPGAELLEQSERNVKGRMTVKLGPITADFLGSAAVERDDAAMTGTVRGAGSDSGSGSRTKADASYRVQPEAGDEQARVSVVVEYNLQGPLAQFSRSSLAQDLGRRLVGEFAANLDARLGGATAAAPAPAALNAGGMVWQLLRQRLKAALDALMGRAPRS